MLCHIAWGSGGGSTGCWSWGQPGAFGDWCKALGCFGVLARAEVDMGTKAVPTLVFMGPLAKASARVSFAWDMECTAPRGARHDGSCVAELATCSILGNVVGQRMEAMRCPAAWGPISGLMPCQHSPWLGPSPHSSCSPWVLGSQAQSEPALPFQTMTRNCGYSRAMGQDHLTAGSGI